MYAQEGTFVKLILKFSRLSQDIAHILQSVGNKF